MDSKKYDKKRMKKAVRAVCVIFALMLVFTCLSWGVASDWGSIKISRITFVGESGDQQSALMFVPKGVNAENPAPAIINYHGRNCSSFSMVNWAIEEARRGYIVLNPDLSGTLETLSTPENNTDNTAVSPYEYLAGLDMVSEISVAGHSMGNMSLQTLASDPEIESNLKSIVGVGGFFFYKITGNPFPTQTNYYILETTADLYAMQWFDTWDELRGFVRELSPQGESLEVGMMYGEPENGTAFLYNELERITHQQQMYSGDVIKEILDFVELSSPAPSPIDNSSMVFQWFQFFSAVCVVLFILFVGSLAYMLTCLPVFYETMTLPLASSNGKSASKWVLQFATDLLIPIALFVPVTNWVAKWPTDIFRSEWVNQIFFWIVSVSLVGAVFIAIRVFRKKKEGVQFTAADFGMGTSEEKIINWKRIGNALLITCITVAAAFGWMDAVITATGLNYQFYTLLAQINRITPERIRFIIPYLLVCIFLVLVMNINIATTRRMKTTGNETRDMIRDIVVNILLSAGALTLLMLIEFVGIRIMGDGSQPFNHIYWSGLSYGWMFPLMMTSSAGLSTFLYRKTGNIWTGTFTSSFTLIFITILNCCATVIDAASTIAK